MARSKKACLIFFDEVDAIGGARFDDGAGAPAGARSAPRRRRARGHARLARPCVAPSAIGPAV
jgi:hypothetical protein